MADRVPPELYVLLGMDPFEWERRLLVNEETLECTLEPRWHSHPALGITGHAHGSKDEARTPHVHRPTWTWDTDHPVFLELEEAARDGD